MKTVMNIFLKGLLVVLPLFITFGILIWLIMSAEELFSVPLQWILPQGWYIAGMGMLGAILLIFVSGILVQSYLTKHFFQMLEWVLGKIPLVNAFYGSARDLMHFAFEKKEKDMRKVVSVEVKEGVFMMGFVTNENVSLPGNVAHGNDKLIAVYFPMSYQVGGYVVYMTPDKCQPLDISVEAAMQKIFTAHVAKSTKI